MPETARDRSVAFFLEHAGWSYDPATETPEQGRYRTATTLADAEAWARGAGVSFEWHDDWSIGNHVAEYDCYDRDPETCETCYAYLSGDVVASLSCIDDATDEYRRVVAAELACDVRTDLERAYVDAYDRAVRALVQS